jgi:putative endonuclease
MFYIYILYSIDFDKYYIGYTSDYVKRLDSHNMSSLNKYTAKYRPWVIKAVFECGEDEGMAKKIESFIKKQKSRKFIEKMIESTQFDKMLAPLVRLFDC